MTDDKTEFVSSVYCCDSVHEVIITSLSTTLRLACTFYVIVCPSLFIGLGK